MVTKLETDSAIPPSTAVIEAVAGHKGVDPLDLKPALFDVIDPDALDALIDNGESVHAPSDTTVRFTYNECRVNVSSGGTVEVSSSHSGV